MLWDGMGGGRWACGGAIWLVEMKPMLTLGRLACHRVANAGIAAVKGLLDTSEEEFERIFQVNVFGVQNCFQAGAKQMIKQGNCSADKPGKLIGVSIGHFERMFGGGCDPWRIFLIEDDVANIFIHYSAQVSSPSNHSLSSRITQPANGLFED